MGDQSPSSDSDDNKSSISLDFRRLFGRENSMHKLLGGGKVADVMLWRNKKASAMTLSMVTFLWVLFECLDYHLLTFVSHVLILSILTMFVWSKGSTFLKRSPPTIPEVKFSEEVFLHFASAARVKANILCAFLHEVSSGKDLKKLVLTLGFLWIFSVIGGLCNFLTLAYIVFVWIQIVPVLYEKNEDKLDAWANVATVEMKKHFRAFDNKFLSRIPRRPASKPKKVK